MDFGYPYEPIMRQCLAALAGVRELISSKQYQRANETIGAGEYGLGLDLLITWLTDDDIAITPAQFAEFQKAAELMGMPDEVDLASLEKYCVSR